MTRQKTNPVKLPSYYLIGELRKATVYFRGRGMIPTKVSRNAGGEFTVTFEGTSKEHRTQ